MSTRARGGGVGGRQFPVGRRRYVPVVDAGCGCRPRRPRLLSLPSFLKPCQQLGGGSKAAAQRSGGGGEQYSCASTSTAASFSSSSAATHSTGYSSAYSDYYYPRPSHVVYGAAVAAKQQQAPPSPLPKQAASPARAPAGGKKQVKAKKKKMYEKKTGQPEEDGGVGVAVEKESCDPRADFRDSMVQMVVEMGLCDWDGLRGMLRRLLALNAPRHHTAILTAFAEVCTQLAGAAAAAAAPPPHPHPHPSSPPAYQYRR
ncbi:hypothetical protein BAE44_0025741 [Dichanthelium oligosanthes]|uniref:Transcription repressor n=1 Tax=Dichanthelium oligosanthes TaxID=888268 RepID=A0A1E5UK54_9POAL|nr:hypothetical protein BAE44_0025741 [Dichanthelium oligosanthes]